MLTLVLKDILVQKRSFTTAAIFSLLFLIAFQSWQGQGAYMMGAIAVVYLFIAGAFSYDERNKGDVLLNSLPLNRKDIVTARYISLLVFTSLGILMEAVTGFIIVSLNIPINIRYMEISDIAAIILSVCLVFSIYIPLYFKFGYFKSRFFNILLYVLCFGVSGVVTTIKQLFTEEQNEQIMNFMIDLTGKIPNWTQGPVFILAVIVILMISFSISLKFYSRREF